MKPKTRQTVTAYRGHAIERLEQDLESFDIPEEHGTSTTYECGVSIVEEKEAF